MGRPLRILTWHVHGNYLYYLSQVPHQFLVVADADRTPHHGGRCGTLPWGDNVQDAPVEQIREMAFDVILFQSRDAYEQEQHTLLTASQRRLPRIYLEHDPPQDHPTNTRHWVQDGETWLIHCTPFNALMWDNGQQPVRVIEHGVRLLTHAVHHGETPAGLVVVNNLDRRGRRLGSDVYHHVSQRIPLTLVGMGAHRLGGAGEVPHRQLPEVMAAHRFLFNPIRYTSLGLAVIEAMMVGTPVVGLATTELATVIRDGHNGHIDTRIDRLIERMQHLLDDPRAARRLGERGRQTAHERFHIDRFVADWTALFREITS